MKVISAQTMQDIDRRAIAEFSVPSLLLMENAGLRCAEEIVARFGVTGRAVIMAGKGNNGGDGYVIARLLEQRGWNVTVIILAERDRIGGDAAINLERLSGTITRYCSVEGQLAPLHGEVIAQADVIVDALLGTGLSGPVSGLYREAIDLVNASGKPVIAVDIPSGVDGTSGQVWGNAVTAHTTVTFACAKLGHVLFPGAEQSGRLVVADIGIPPELLENASGHDFLDAAAIRPLVRRRDRQTHKGRCGHCLIIAGSTGKSGAAALTANSAVRAGSGLVTLTAAARINTVLEIKTTEVMTHPLPDSGCGYLTDSAFAEIETLLTGKSAVAIGPGLGMHPETSSLIRRLVESIEVPLVIDADGLNAIAEDIRILKRKKSAPIILTPHPGEMSRLLGIPISDIEANRLAVARDFSRTHDVFLVLKGARTVIASPDGTTALNGSGNPGMASGGMGDVLTGIIVSLLGQGYPAGDTCRLGVFLHGHAADMVAAEKGEIGITASDVIEMLPAAYHHIITNTAPDPYVR